MIAGRARFAHTSGSDQHGRRDVSWCAELSRQAPSEAVGRLIEHAVKIGASDLFFSSAEAGVTVTVRRLGRIEHIGQVPTAQGLPCITFVRTMAGMKLEENRRPQDGRWEFVVPDGHRIQLRVSTVPTVYGPSVAMRILDVQGRPRTLDMLGLVGPQRDTLTDLLNTPGGLILVTGPTGSGKSTTLYACLDYLNDGSRKIHTLEDPIEYVLPGLHQTQVSDFSGSGFFELLRGVMRQNPDVIMIGEVRDPVTAETAIRAANSGQLVFATLHAGVSAAAIHNMLEYGVRAEFLASALSAIVSQRLVRTLAGGSRRQIDPAAASHTFDEVKPWLDDDAPVTAYLPANSRGSDGGYVGQTGVFEVLRVTPAVRQLILDRAPAHAMADAAAAEGMFDFHRAGLLQVAQGVTSLDEIRRHVPLRLPVDAAVSG
jgi:type II secretory ATPase GspE/PulE/Tfp pilus assembly ATPase PilB-like protein